MIKKLALPVFFTILAPACFAAERALDIDLAKQVLAETNRVASAKAGEMRYDPQEVLAFNIVFRAPDANGIFKEVYRRSGSAGKIYALVALYLRKDPDFGKLRDEFLNSTQPPVDTQYGCKGGNDDAKRVLQTWIEGIPRGLWYTNIVIKETR
jgi:hypothetical protein